MTLALAALVVAASLAILAAVLLRRRALARKRLPDPVAVAAVRDRTEALASPPHFAVLPIPAGLGLRPSAASGCFWATDVAGRRGCLRSGGACAGREGCGDFVPAHPAVRWTP